MGMPQHPSVVPTCIVLPMGWSSSVGLMQQASRELINRVRLPPSDELHRQSLNELPPSGSFKFYLETAVQRPGGKSTWTTSWPQR